MPPGRKKGATKADNLAKFSVGDLVLAKVKGFPAWPAKISRAEDWKREPDQKKVFVHFFGTGEIAFVAPADVQVFNVEARKSLLARLQGKSIKYFAKAVREICDAHDKPNSQDPISSSENGSMTSEGPLEVQVNAQTEEACAAAVLRDDDCLDESGKEPQNLHIDGNESVTDHSMTKFDDTKASIGAQSPSKIASTEVSNNHTPLGEDVTRHQSKDTLMKSTDKPKSAYYTKGSRIKKLKLETDGFEGVTNNENIDSKQKEVICDGDSGKAAEECMRKKATNNKSATESLPAALKSDSEAADVKKKGSLVKSKKVLKVEGKADVPKNQMRDDLSGRKRKAQLVSKKADVADTDLSCPDSVKSNGEISDEGGKKPQVKRRKVDPSSVTEEKDEKHPETNLRDQTSAVPETGNVEDGDSNVETAFALTKECVLALEASSASVRTSEKKVIDKATPDVLPSTDPKPLSNLSRTKRRAVCIVGDVEERPRTPVHRGSSQKAKAVTPAVGPCVKLDGLNGRSKASQRHNEDCTKSGTTPLGRCSKSSKLLIESTDSPEDMVKIKSKGNTSLPVSHAPRRTEFEKLIDSTGDQALGSSQAPLNADAKKIMENQKGIDMSSKIMSSGDLKKTQVEVSGSQSVGMSKAGNPTLRNKSTPGDRPKITSKVRPKLNQAATETLTEKRSSLVGIQRVDIEDPSSVLNESRMSESDKSMRLLIAAAQAKRTAARSQSIAHPVNTMFDPVGSVVHKNSSPGMMEDLRRVNSMTATLSPSMFAAQNPSEPQIGTEKHEGRVSSSHQSTRGSLSGGTEAAVARDAFEGMIETLSRTKESIGRATRLAIDCAKYGIATEVVELLIRKLENEPNLHHRVDLFFLVDSIMQCSHNQKGIAGASYATTVEGALPRLLSAAAPSGSGARENRRQCLKVLRLWLERKIFPATVLRRYMDDIGVSNGDASGSTSFKRPSRAERSVDDPIREMEGMLVDEYGSNAAMQLPSFLTSRIFEDEDDNLLSTLSKISDEAAQTSDENQELLVARSSDTRSCTPKNLNGELEMEDVFGQRKDDCPSNDLSEKDSQQGVPVPARRCNETTSNNCHDFPPLPLVSSSPSPPLPSSPAPSPPPPPPQQSPPPPPPPQSPPPPLSPPPPPPPSSPPPPPPHPPHPPPFPSHPHPQPVPSHVPSYPSHAPFTSLAPPPPIPLPPSARPMFMPLMRSQYAVSPQNTLSSQPLPAPQLHTSQLAYQPCGPSNTPGEIQPIPNRGNAIHGQYGPVIPAVTVPAPPPQPLSSHFSYANSGVQQGPYHTSYGLHPPPDGNRPFGTESQFPHNPQNMWSSGGTGPSPSQPFVQEGYYQQASQRPITNNLGFQQSSNSMPAGAPVPGHSAVHIWPRPDIAASNCWRPT
ncbi:hypothetical protein QQ045_012782 [Rhodiola kirilowii]